MFGMGPTELIVIAVLVVLLFGAAKIPELGRGIGEGISNFKRGLKEASEADEAQKRLDDKSTPPASGGESGGSGSGGGTRNT